MTDIRCWRCSEKIGWQTPDARGVTILCNAMREDGARCAAKNAIGRDHAPPALDNRLVLVRT